MNTKIESLLKLALKNKASDVHLSTSILPKFRINGELNSVGNFELPDKTEMVDMILSILSKEQKDRFLSEKDLDFSVTVDDARFRANVFFDNGLPAMVLRVIPVDIPTMEELGMPPVMNSWLKIKQGFILVTGPTGQGKSTTVASMLNEINKNIGGHIVTVEDPIEYVIKPLKSLISQRELGTDTKSFDRALRSVLRQDPNVVFVGEMRDLETIQLALTVAETGHLVFSTLHTNSASSTIDRIVDVFPEGSKAQVRTQLASVLTAVVSQRLLPSVDGGRVAAMEIMVANNAVRNTIREGKSFMIDNIIQTGSDVGMFSLEMYLAKLVKLGKITEEVALNYSVKPVELQSSLRSTRLKNG
jgi:twitching motility protein PilT